MIRHYTLSDGRITATEAGREGNIILVTNPTSDEKVALMRLHRIDEHDLSSTQDPHELPRVELEEDHLVVIFKQPKRYEQDDNFFFKINAAGLFLYRDKLIVVVPEEMSAPFEGKSFSKVGSLQMLFLRILSACVGHFMSHLQVIDDIANSLEDKLVKSMENRSLLQMFSIEKSLVYYVNAISANGRIIDKLKANARNDKTEGLTSEMLDYVDDLSIENSQCLEQAQVYANVFTGLMDARASVVSNNLNSLMKRLTVFNVLFMPLNVLVGIGGMSEFSMMTAGIPWPFAYGALAFALFLIGVTMYKVIAVVEQRHVT
jgi:magnesium transporter